MQGRCPERYWHQLSYRAGSIIFSCYGFTRERLIAVHFAYMLHARLKPEQFMCVLSCKTAVAEKASKQHQQLSIDKENKLLESLNNLVIEAKKILNWILKN